jgi:antitoxin component YwqK of YwqJK toxin-antitoxin module
MFHKLKSLNYCDDFLIIVEFEDGSVKRYNIENLFQDYPQFKILKDKELFKSGKLEKYGIIWNDELDLSSEEIYQNGVNIGG